MILFLKPNWKLIHNADYVKLKTFQEKSPLLLRKVLCMQNQTSKPGMTLVVESHFKAFSKLFFSLIFSLILFEKIFRLFGQKIETHVLSATDLEQKWSSHSKVTLDRERIWRLRLLLARVVG